MEKIICLIAFLACAVHADNTPVLIWSSSRSMSDMPQSYIGHKLESEKFHDSYLKPLSSDPKNNLVIFAQNKLSIEDFTNHADVYNPNSDGGVFKNVKSAMEDDFSVQLPSVTNPMESISQLEKTYDGRVVKVDNPDDLAKAELTDGKSYLILVTLKPVDGVNEAKAFEENDQMIGKCMHHLNKRGVKYTALYTAHTSTKHEAAEEFKSRHLLDYADDDHKDPMFFKDALVMMSLRYVELSISRPGGVDKPAIFMQGNGTRFPATGFNFTTKIVSENVTSNDTVGVTMNLVNAQGKLTMSYLLWFNSHDEWRSTNGTMTYAGSANETKDFSFDGMPVDYKILAPRGFCFHCSALYPAMVLKGYNNTAKLTVGVALKGFQIQAYNRNGTSEVFTDFVWDCVEFFSVAIWMGIISTAILVIVLFFALTMVANITTMDRFDDPKGKPLTITVNE